MTLPEELETNLENVAPVLDDLRKQLGMSQDEVAHKLNSSQAWYSRIAQGKSEPRINSLVRIFGLFGYDVKLKAVKRK